MGGGGREREREGEREMLQLFSIREAACFS